MLGQCGFHTLNHAYILTTLAITHSLLPSNPPYLVAPWLQHVEPLLALREPTFLSCEEAVSQEEITELSNSGIQCSSCQESYYSDVCGKVSAKYPKIHEHWDSGMFRDCVSTGKQVCRPEIATNYLRLQRLSLYKSSVASPSD